MESYLLVAFYFLVVYGVVRGIAALEPSSESDEQKNAWREVARGLGLQLDESAPDRRPVLRGTSEGLRVQIQPLLPKPPSGRAVRDNSPIGWTVVIDTQGLIPATLKLSTSESSLAIRFKKQRGRLVGDSEFDQRIWIDGPPNLVTALLDWDTRRNLVRISQAHELKLEDGTLTLTNAIPRPPFSGARTFLAEATRIARSLTLGERTEAEWLARNAIHDPSGVVRENNFRLLLEHHPSTQGARDAAAAMLASETSDGAVKLEAARFLEEEGIVELERVVLRSDIEATIRFQMWELLEESLEAGRFVRLLGAALGSINPSVQTPAVRLTRKLKLVKLADRLISALPNAPGELTVEILRVLVELVPEEVEGVLIAQLERRESEVRATAAEALGDHGTIAAVEPLLECSEGIFVDWEVKKAARESIARIQDRLGNAEEGRLSVADLPSAAGGLTDPAGESGKLAFADDEAED